MDDPSYMTEINKALADVTETREIRIGQGILTEIPALFSRHFPGQKAVIVADETTFRAAGQQVDSVLTTAGLMGADLVVFPSSPMLYASFDMVTRLADILRKNDAIPVAVGSGTVNDLTKLASHQLGRRYMVVATAASMDGYTASGASISKDGFKQTFACPAPVVVAADLDVMIHAPYSMTASGYADLLAKNVAGADWIIADALGIEPVNPRTWEIVQGPLRESTGSPALLRSNDATAFAGLVRGLLMSGLSLQHYHASRPASGAEHLISHVWEMEETEHGEFSHGLKVGLGTIASAALFDRVLARDLSRINVDRMISAYPLREEVSAYIRKSFTNSAVIESAIQQSMAKYPEPDEIRDRLTYVKNYWPELKLKLQTQLIHAPEMQNMLKEAGCFTNPADIRKTNNDLLKAYRQARLIRNRYTILDFAEDTGCLEECLAGIFSTGGFWAGHGKIDAL